MAIERTGRISAVAVYILKGLLVTAILLAAKSLAEQSPIGHQAEMLAFEFLQARLSPFKKEERLPILVVDMSEVPGGRGQITPRDTLRSLVDAMAHSNQKPKAIAIDLDFSPDASGWRDEADPEFFDFCLKVGVPIFLGVYRTRAEGASAWLGLPEYSPLAAGLVVQEDDTSRVPQWIQAKGSPDRLPTLGRALAGAYRTRLPEPPGWLRWAVEMTADNEHGLGKESEGYIFAEALVNYSKIDQIDHERLRTISPCSVKEAGDFFLNKMVIIGDASEFTDPFVVPGANRAIPGVYLQACAAYTLAIEPLFEFRPPARLGFDALISVLIILSVAYVRFRDPGSERRADSKWQARLVFAAVAAVVLGGILLVRLASILWLDFALVVFALLLHPSAEDWLSKLWGRLGRKKSASSARSEDSP